MQLNFLDSDTGLTGQFDTGKAAPVARLPVQPTLANKSEQIGQIMEAMDWSRSHEYGVTTARMREICGERSYRQRISDARKLYQKKGLNIVYRQAGDSYFLEPYTVK